MYKILSKRPICKIQNYIIMNKLKFRDLLERDIDGFWWVNNRIYVASKRDGFMYRRWGRNRGRKEVVFLLGLLSVDLYLYI